MSVAELFLCAMGFSALFIVWVIAFFVLDDFVLNGYVKKKLQKRFKAE